MRTGCRVKSSACRKGGGSGESASRFGLNEKARFQSQFHKLVFYLNIFGLSGGDPGDYDNIVPGKYAVPVQPLDFPDPPL